jgi:hypothetical protein
LQFALPGEGDSAAPPVVCASLQGGGRGSFVARCRSEGLSVDQNPRVVAACLNASELGLIVRGMAKTIPPSSSTLA